MRLLEGRVARARDAELALLARTLVGELGGGDSAAGR
jgi:hypothetical protein